jgi:hypothetical protein
MLVNALQEEVEALLARSHFSQGNISDLFWDNTHLQAALKNLAKAKPFDFVPFSRRQLPRKHLPKQKSRIADLIALLEKDRPGFVKTLTCDGCGIVLALC